jgi:hypothetical protein
LQTLPLERSHNLYEDADGESHFRDIEVDWAEETPSGKMSKRLPATGILFRETTADYENSWHRAATPTICDQPGRWDLDHRQRRRNPPHRRRRDCAGLGHHRQGPHHQIIGRQTAPHDLRADRLIGCRGGGLPAAGGTQLIPGWTVSRARSQRELSRETPSAQRASFVTQLLVETLKAPLSDCYFTM